jgi:hypothetical protein
MKKATTMLSRPFDFAHLSSGEVEGDQIEGARARDLILFVFNKKQQIGSLLSA